MRSVRVALRTDTRARAILWEIVENDPWVAVERIALDVVGVVLPMRDNIVFTYRDRDEERGS